ncbi:MAG: O-antigen ligase family protein [candidate division KSB1 bacterium]|nr:O-antigen ligase family protein [candidate division KSB1 bacterium]
MLISKAIARYSGIVVVISSAAVLILLRLQLPTKFLALAILAAVFPAVLLLVKDARRFLLAAACFSIPLHLDVNFIHLFEHQAGASTLGISLTDILVVLLLFQLLIRNAAAKQPTAVFFPKIGLPLILYLEAAALSMLWAPRLDLAVMEVVRMAKFTLMFFVLLNHLREEQDVRLVAWSLLAAVALQSFLATAQMVRGGVLGLDFLGEAPPDADDETSIWRAMGTLGHPNKLATFLEVLLLLPLAAYLFEKKKPLRLIALLIFFLGVPAMMMTGSRGAWISFAAAMAFFGLFLLTSRHVRPTTIIKLAMAGVFILTLIAGTMSEMLYQRLFGPDYGSAAGRIPMFKIALNIISAHPAGGVGINNYQVNMRNYNDAVESLRYVAITRPVHNMYLLVAGETGVIGLAAMLSVLLGLFSTLRRARTSQAPMISLTAAALYGGMIAFCVHGLVDKHPPGGSAIFYVVAALAAGLVVIDRKRVETVRPAEALYV